nr:iron permease [Methylibium sp.]
MNNTRRTFLMTVAAGGAVFTSTARAQAKLDEKDPQALAL